MTQVLVMGMFLISVGIVLVMRFILYPSVLKDLNAVLGLSSMIMGGCLILLYARYEYSVAVYEGRTVVDIEEVTVDAKGDTTDIKYKITQLE